uniref:Replication-associated protein n=1 Tax=Cressdnaviricota sp. TaxID=2748378 RepID=A0A890UR80_9VIRU|nr:MAG: replication-associated protein [Cressdnaviricota sp.]
MPPRQARQARYWMLTIPFDDFEQPNQLPEGIDYLKGQGETGNNTGYDHWQLIVYFSKKVSLVRIKQLFGQTCHAEPTRSDACEEYVWKDDTAKPNTRFEMGTLPMKRNSKTDWAKVKTSAVANDLNSIDPDVYVRYYHSLKRIAKDHANAPYRPTVQVNVFWGVTGSGKSHRAHDEAGDDVYYKSSTTKWWDGYKGEKNVIIDEYRGQISIEHLLRWFDKYPCYVEEKGGQLPLLATNFWVCSNLSPDDWYPQADEMVKAALRRRLRVTHFSLPFRNI